MMLMILVVYARSNKLVVHLIYDLLPDIHVHRRAQSEWWFCWAIPACLHHTYLCKYPIILKLGTVISPVVVALHTRRRSVMIDQLPDWCEIRSDRRHHHLMPKAIFLNRLTSWSARNFMHASRRLASSSFDLFPSTMHATCFFLTLQYISFFFIFGIIWKLLLTKYSTIYVHRVWVGT
jgi:hypothetical protein